MKSWLRHWLYKYVCHLSFIDIVFRRVLLVTDQCVGYCYEYMYNGNYIRR